MRRLGCLTPLGLFAGLLALLLVGVTAVVGGGAMFSPGALSTRSDDGQTLGGVTSHAQVGGRCAACHVDPWSSEIMATRCLDCHTSIRTDLADPQSLHSVMPEVMQCRQCHTEHNGADGALTRVVPDNFPHERVGFALTAHAQRADGQPFDCADCHTVELAEFDRAECETCHRRDQAEFMAQHVIDFGAACLDCHDGVDRYSDFDHNRLEFALTGEHAQETCGQCHTQVRAAADFATASPACIDCHREDDEHNGQFGTDCAVCHTSEDWDSAHFDHDATAFKLVGQHQTIECEQCHVNKVFRGTPQTCLSCHAADDKHAGQYGPDCAQCHTAVAWADATFDHNLAAFKLEGQHLTVECAKCHVNGVYQGTPQTCVACHAADDVHAGQYGTDCAQCHHAGDWADAKFDHNLAAFKLTGAHLTVQCARCHLNGVYQGTPQACVSCHAEPQEHLGAFGTDCAACHSTATWEGATFAHTFPLNHGEGGTIACQTCHVTPNFKEYTCYNCHEHDPARVQAEHLEEGISNFQNCMECHPTGREEEGERD